MHGKLCTKCRTSKPLEAFALRKSGTPHSWCRECKRAWDRIAPRVRGRSPHRRTHPIWTAKPGTEVVLTPKQRRCWYVIAHNAKRKIQSKSFMFRGEKLCRVTVL